MLWDFHALDPNSHLGSTRIDQTVGQLEADDEFGAEEAARAAFVAEHGERDEIRVEVSRALRRR
jgi:hypothetical protein